MNFGVIQEIKVYSRFKKTKFSEKIIYLKFLIIKNIRLKKYKDLNIINQKIY